MLERRDSRPVSTLTLLTRLTVSYLFRDSARCLWYCLNLVTFRLLQSVSASGHLHCSVCCLSLHCWCSTGIGSRFFLKLFTTSISQSAVKPIPLVSIFFYHPLISPTRYNFEESLSFSMHGSASTVWPKTQINLRRSCLTLINVSVIFLLIPALVLHWHSLFKTVKHLR